MHGASTVCSHCHTNRLDHIARTLTKVCASVLSANGLVVPSDDKRGQEEFSSRAAFWACFQAYANEVCSALADWLKDVSAKQVEGDINFLIPKLQIHGNACGEECHEGFKADVKKVLDEEFGTDTPFKIKMGLPPLLLAKKDTAGGKTSNLGSEPQTNEDKDSEADTRETGEGEIPSKHACRT